MFDKIANPFGEKKFTCPVCGSDHTVTRPIKRIPFVVDGPSGIMCECKTCGHCWPLVMRMGSMRQL